MHAWQLGDWAWAVMVILLFYFLAVAGWGMWWLWMGWASMRWYQQRDRRWALETVGVIAGDSRSIAKPWYVRRWERREARRGG